MKAIQIAERALETHARWNEGQDEISEIDLIDELAHALKVMIEATTGGSA